MHNEIYRSFKGVSSKIFDWISLSVLGVSSYLFPILFVNKTEDSIIKNALVYD